MMVGMVTITRVRQPASQRGAQAQHFAEEQHAHQAEDDGGDAGEGLGGEFDGGHQLLVLGVLRKVYRRPHPQGQGDEQGAYHQVDGVE